MQFGLAINHAGQQLPLPHLASLARRAESLGFDALLSGDHIVLPLVDQGDHPYSEDGVFEHDTNFRQGHLIESMTLLGYIAAVTERIALGTSVMVLPYRNPVISAKEWASLDVMSGGRTICGVGVGWSRWAFESLGIPFQERGRRMDEYIQVMRTLWTNEKSEFHGEFADFDGIGFLPKPIQDPLPIWVGGYSRAAVQRAGRFAQVWHATRATPEKMAAMIPYLRQCASAAGRDPAEIGISLKRRLHFTDIDLDPGDLPVTDEEVMGTAADVVADVRRCRELGITQLTYDFRTSDADAQIAIIERLAEYALNAAAD